jgi:gliding motility-associated-like protein
LYTLPGTFQVALVVRNEFNCADTVVKSLNVEPDFSFYIPNAFTPDGDGKNDYFSAVLRSTKFFSLKIYNRWGIELFYTTDSSEGWNGKSNGVECPADSYSWQIELTTANGQKKQLSGMVVLIR